MKVSLIIPAYNEQERLPPFLESIVHYLSRHRKDIYEIIVVDDGSTDNTVTVDQRFQKKLPLHILKLQPNQGKGAAVRAGVMSAKGDALVFMDADGATDISELPKMIQALTTVPIAIGNRWMKGAHAERHSFIRRFGGWSYRTYLRLFGLGGIDTMCGFKGYHRIVGRELFRNLQEKRWLFDTEIAYKALRRHYPIKNFPIRWESKDGSKLATRTLLKSAWHLWPLLRRLKKSKA